MDKLINWLHKIVFENWLVKWLTPVPPQTILLPGVGLVNLADVRFVSGVIETQDGVRWEIGEGWEEYTR